MPGFDKKYSYALPITVDFNEKKYTAHSISMQQDHGLSGEIYSTSVFSAKNFSSYRGYSNRFELKMFDEKLSMAFEDWQATNEGYPRVDVDIKVESDLISIKGAIVAEYFKENLVLIDGLVMTDKRAIKITFSDIETIKMLEDTERKRPFLKRFRNILDLED
jgi:hypothetical protein